MILSSKELAWLGRLWFHVSGRNASYSHILSVLWKTQRVESHVHVVDISTIYYPTRWHSNQSWQGRLVYCRLVVTSEWVVGTRFKAIDFRMGCWNNEILINVTKCDLQHAFRCSKKTRTWDRWWQVESEMERIPPCERKSQPNPSLLPVMPIDL
jgi:hypothetical protein